MSFVWADIEVLGSRNPTLASSVGTIACVTMSSKAEILRPETSTAATDCLACNVCWLYCAMLNPSLRWLTSRKYHYSLTIEINSEDHKSDNYI